jgi:hypothetical protein
LAAACKADRADDAPLLALFDKLTEEDDPRLPWLKRFLAVRAKWLGFHRRQETKRTRKRLARLHHAFDMEF